MFSDLDKSTAFICRRSFEETSLDICDDDTLRYSALYEELLEKKDSLDKLQYIFENDNIVNIRMILPYDGVKFIKMAYMSILGRMPEEQAVTSLQAVLSSDSSRESKTNILRNIGISEEAKLRGMKITGFESININEFYQYSDREFIENAYIKILLRRPDPNGAEVYLSMLRSLEYTPAEILYMLRHSEEGELCGVEIPGLEEAYRKRMKRKKLMNIPVIGRCGRYIVHLLGANRRMNALTRENYWLRDELYNNKRAMECSSSSLEQRINANNGIADRLSQQVSDLSGKISALSDGSKMISDKISGFAKQSDLLEEEISALKGRIEKFENEISENVNKLNAVEEETAALKGRTESFENKISENVNKLYAVEEQISGFAKRSEMAESSLRELDGFTHQIGNNVNDLNKAREYYDSILSGYVHEDKKTIQLLLAEVFSLKARINALEKGAAGTSAENSSQSEKLIPDTAPASDVYGSIDYFDFENHFRGSREHIKAVQKIYIPYFEGKRNVLDLGCGRGEFTELLKENNIGVTGVDRYEPYVEYMKSLGLPAILDDAVAYLSRQESTDGIFLGQVIEHITTDQIVTICNMAYEKLEDGCCLIMETPNPRSLAIYTECFYMDPSHQKPVHPFTLKYIAEKAGFSQVDILYTDSSRLPFSIPKIKEDEPDFEKFNEAMQRVSELLYGSQDYAVIARK